MELLSLPPEILTRIFSSPGVAEKMILVSKFLKNFILDPYVLREIGKRPITGKELAYEVTHYFHLSNRKGGDPSPLILFKFEDEDSILESFIEINYLEDEKDYNFYLVMTQAEEGQILRDGPYHEEEIDDSESEELIETLQRYLDDGYMILDPLPLYYIFQSRLWESSKINNYAIHRTREIIKGYLEKIEEIINRNSRYKGIADFLRSNIFYFEPEDYPENFLDFEGRLRRVIREVREKEVGEKEKEEKEEEEEEDEELTEWEKEKRRERENAKREELMDREADDTDLPLLKKIMMEYNKEILDFLPRYLVKQRGYR